MHRQMPSSCACLMPTHRVCCVKVNCIAPNARTRMTEGLGFYKDVKEGEFDPFHASNNAPPVVYFGSDACDVGGVVLLLNGESMSVMENWRPGKTATKEGAPWDPRELVNTIPGMVVGSAEHPMYVTMKEATAAKAAAKKKSKL